MLGKMSQPLKGRRLLVIDDELAIRNALQARVEDDGAHCSTAVDVASARAKIAAEEFDLLVLDHRLPDGTGLSLLRQLRDEGYPAEVVLMTAYSSTEDAVRAMKIGAADYVMKPFDLDEMILVIQRALDHRELRGEVRRFRARDRKHGAVHNLLGDSRETVELRSLVERIANSGARTILIRGETGTGKDLVARAIHYASPQADRPFLNITCTALTETLLESELFGHEKGAFTDAKQPKMGLFEQADGGTIFLDEVGDMPLSLQAKLLRFLESKQFRRVGGLKDIAVEVRIVAATNRDLEEAIEAGEFRSDLYYRLNVIPIEISPLRSRREDIIPLVQHFTRKFTEELRKPEMQFTPEATRILERYDWPGNVRELKNCVERAVLLATGSSLGVADVPAHMRVAASPLVDEPGRPLVLPEAGVVLDDLLRDLLDQALERTHGNKSRAATLLGIHRDQVRYWVKKYKLTRWIRTQSSPQSR